MDMPNFIKPTQAPGLGKLFLESFVHCSSASVTDRGRVDMISVARADTLEGRLDPMLRMTPKASRWSTVMSWSASSTRFS
jgi:hypothetical protein